MAKEKIQNVTLVTFNARAVSGLVQDETDALPSATAFTPRGVRYLPASALRRFGALRSSLQNKMLRLGTRFLGGYAVPNARIDEVRDIIDLHRQGWEDAKVELLANYDQLTGEWIAANPEVFAYRALFPSSQSIARRIGFDSVLIQIDAGGVQDGLSAALGKLPEQIIEEVAADVRASWSKGALSAKTTPILDRAARKLEGLEFLGGDLGAIAHALRGMVDTLPKTGGYAPADTALAGMLLAVLSDANTARGILKMDRATAILMMSGATTAAPAPQVLDFEEAGEGEMAPAAVVADPIASEAPSESPATESTASPLVFEDEDDGEAKGVALQTDDEDEFYLSF